MVASVSKLDRDNAPPHFWETVADELFENVRALMEPVDWFMSNRAENEGFSAILVRSNPVYFCSAAANTCFAAILTLRFGNSVFATSTHSYMLVSSLCDSLCESTHLLTIQQCALALCLRLSPT